MVDLNLLRSSAGKARDDAAAELDGLVYHERQIEEGRAKAERLTRFADELEQLLAQVDPTYRRVTPQLADFRGRMRHL